MSLGGHFCDILDALEIGLDMVETKIKTNCTSYEHVTNK